MKIQKLLMSATIAALVVTGAPTLAVENAFGEGKAAGGFGAGAGKKGAAAKGAEKKGAEQKAAEKKGSAFGDDADSGKKSAARAKKLPKKQAMYFNWQQAKRVAMEYEQPVIAFISLDGDESCQKVRRFSILRPEFLKMFAPDNVVLYQYKVELLKERTRGNRNKKPAAKPDKESIRKSEKSFVEGLMGGRSWTFPKLVLVSPKDGTLISDLGGLKMDSASEWIESLKSELEGARYKVTISPKLQKLIDADKKRRARSAK